MIPIASIYITCVQDIYSAEFIANAFDRLGIAKVNRVAIEPFKIGIKTRLEKYNRVYVGISYWHDTKAAFNFMQHLKNPYKECRFIYDDDNWWVIEINKFPHKLESSNKKNTLTIFKENNTVEPSYKNFNNNLNNETIIDFEKTKLLKNIISNLKMNESLNSKKIMDQQNDIKIFDFLKNTIRNLTINESLNSKKITDQQNDIKIFDDYLREIDEKRYEVYNKT
jgi:hypothetical protein